MEQQKMTLKLTLENDIRVSLSSLPSIIFSHKTKPTLHVTPAWDSFTRVYTGRERSDATEYNRTHYDQ